VYIITVVHAGQMLRVGQVCDSSTCRASDTCRASVIVGQVETIGKAGQ
jgi:hypothetical protein